MAERIADDHAWWLSFGARLESHQQLGGHTRRALIEGMLEIAQLCRPWARRTLDRILQDPEAEERFCRVVLGQDHPVVQEIALSAGYAPVARKPRALCSYLTEQWKAYEDLDLDDHQLYEVYELANEGLPARLRAPDRRAARNDIVDAVVGGQPW